MRQLRLTAPPLSLHCHHLEPQRRISPPSLTVLQVLSLARCCLAARLASLCAPSIRHRSSIDATLSGVVLPKRPMQDLEIFGWRLRAALASNDSGEVDRGADVSGPCAQISHAFLWERYVMTDLGTVDGDTCSYANAINSSGQIVGESRACDFSVQHAVLWQDGQIIDFEHAYSTKCCFVPHTGLRY
jgi:probable HAF family extracellular repeat protein